MCFSYLKQKGNSSDADFSSFIPGEQKLIMQLLRNYDPDSRPVFNSSRSITVRFGLSLIHINDIDEKNQILTINAWLEEV